MRVVGFATLLIGVAICRLSGQSPEPAFETAFVSLSPAVHMSARFEMTGGPGTVEPTRITFRNCPLADVIAVAFDVPLGHIRLPGWTSSALIDLNATTPRGTTQEQYHAMLRGLLAAKFHLRTHWEAANVDSYELVQAPGGHKLRPPTGPAQPTPNEEELRSLPEAPDGLPIFPPLRTMMVWDSNRARAQAVDESLHRLRALVSSEVGAFVGDATGLTGRFDYSITWTLSNPRPMPSGYPKPAPRPDTPPPMLIALESQLGLRVQKRTAEVRSLVVDSLDRTPAGN